MKFDYLQRTLTERITCGEETQKWQNPTLNSTLGQ